MSGHADRAHALLSASSAHRWINCPPSALIAETYPKQDTDFTREGTLAHEVAEIFAKARLNPGTVVDFGVLKPGEAITSEMQECAVSYADYIQEQIKSDDAEVLLEQRVDFSDWVPDGFGTCDCIILQGDTLTIIDYKYGKGVEVSALDNPQLKLYALGALSDFGVAYDIKQIEMHIFQPRLNNVSTDTTAVKELLRWAEDVVENAAEDAVRGRGLFRAGEHCRFCPHAGRCRELNTYCTEYVETHGIEVEKPVLARWEVADVLKMEPIITLWLKRVKAQAVTDMLNGEAVPGYKVVAGRGSRAWSDEEKVERTLREIGVPYDTVHTRELMSVAAMEKALGKDIMSTFLEDHIVKKTGAPTIAPETDKRPVYNRVAEAIKDFEEERR
jgi:hypothetical protein